MLVSKRDVLRLDPDLLKVLASDRRRDILHHLKKRRMTVTELSRSMDLGKPTVLDHLKRLQDAGLVVRHEDERLWVYYSLSDRGRGFVGPSKIPVFLMLGGFLLALAIAFAVVNLSPDAGGDPAPALSVIVETPASGYALYPGAGGSFGLVVSAGQGDPATWTVALTDAGPSASERPALVVPLSVQADGTGLRAVAPPAIEPGRYHLFVEDAAGHDNRAAMPAIVVPRMVTAGVPDTWWQGLDGTLVMKIEADGAAIDGTLRLVSEAGTTIEGQVRGGEVQIPAGALDQAAPGRHALVYVPAERDLDVPLETVIVYATDFEIAPRVVHEGNVQFLIHAWSAVAPHEEPNTLSVRVAGSVASVYREGGGTFRASVAASPGNATLEVGRLGPVAVQVLPDVSLRFERLQGPELRLRVDRPDGPVAGATVRLDGALLGTTDGAGAVQTDWPLEGIHRVTVQIAGAPPVERTVVVQGDTLSAPAATPLILVTGAATTSSGVATFEVRVSNPTNETQEATLAATSGARVFSVRHLVVPAQGVLSVELSGAPTGAGVVQVQAFRVPEVPVSYIDRTQQTGSGTTTSTGTTTSGTQTTTQTTSPSAFDTSLLGEAASASKQITVEAVSLTNTAAPASNDGTGTSTPMPGVGVLVVLLVALARRRR